MTFEDAIAYSRNVVAAKVALGLGDDDPRVVGDPLRHVAAARATASRPGSTWPARSAGIVRDPALTPWREIDLANGAFGQGVAVTPIQLATAYAALVNGGTLVQPHVVKAIGDDGRRRRRRATRVIDARPVADPRRDDAATSSPRCRSTATGRSSRATTSAARPAPPRSGTRPRTTAAAPGSATCSTTRSSATSAARPGVPDLVVAIQIEEGTPDGRPGRPPGDAGHVVRAVPADRHRRDHDAGPADRPADRRRP